MTNDLLQQLWNHPGNRLPEADEQKLLQQFNSRLRRQRRGQLIWLSWTALQLVLLAGITVWAVARGQATADWGVLPLLLLPYAVFFLLLRVYLRSRYAAPAAVINIRDSVMSAWHANAASRLRTKILAGMYAAVLPLLALAVWQLRVSGKVTPQQMWCMVSALSAALIIAASLVAVNYFRRQLPQYRQLERIRQQLDSANDNH